MSVTIRQAFPNSFGAAIPILTPLYGLKCDVWQFMDEREVVLGSDSDCEFVLPLEGVEKRHCTLIFRAGALSVRRNEGRVWINDIPVGRECSLILGDMLTIGPRSFLVGQLDRTSPKVGISPTVHQSVVPVVPFTGANSQAITPAVDTAAAFADTAASIVQTIVQPSPTAATLHAAAVEIIELEVKRKALESRELQLFELSGIVKERERSLAERQQMLEERTALLTEKRASIESTQSSFAALEQTLKREKDDIHGRMSVLVERELTLANQFEASAVSYTQMEQTRLALAQQLDEVDRRAAQIAAKQSELNLFANQLESKESELAAQASELSGKSTAVMMREADLEARLASLISREQHVDVVVENRSSDFDARQKAIAECETAARERLQIVNQREEEVRTIRDELESLRGDLMRQNVELDERSTQLVTRTAALDVTASELAASRLAMDAASSNSVAETRSVGQLAAIAAERESAIRAKQEAFQALTELTNMRESLAAQESKLSAWQTEIDARHRELADRVVAMKQLRQTAVTTNTPDSSHAEQASSLHNEWQKLAARHAELDIKEAQIDELQANALAISRAAEAERDALQNSHKDLFCERNSLMQLSQDLQSRASGLHEREAKVQHQTEELRSRFDALHQQTAEFNKLEAELDARAADLNRRTAEFAAASSESSQLKPQSLISVDHANSGATPASLSDNVQATELANSLRVMESERDAIAAQRDALMTAVRELQQAMQNAQADVEEARRVRLEFERQEEKINELYQTIEEKGGQLQLTDSRFRQTVEHLETLQAQIAQLAQERDNALNRLPVDRPSTEFSSTDEHDAFLLSQIEELRHELSDSKSGGSNRLEQSHQEIAERDQIIADLRAELANVGDRASTSNSLANSIGADSIDMDKLRSRLDRADEVLRDRDDLIRELRARLMKQTDTTAAESVDPESLQLEALELDRRATLLDRREAEIREQARRVTQSEDEVESQRRQLLDARQQLEIARAEIQVAMKQHGTNSESSGTSALYEASTRSASVPIHESLGGAFGSPIMADSEPESSSSSSDLRAELANLFGLKKPAAEPDASLTTPKPDFFDLSEPAGESKAVSFHFDEHSSGIFQTPPPLPVASSEAAAEPAREENSDDFVRDYMEQLLSRSRNAAGNSLPEELKSPQAKRQPVPSGPTAASSKKNEAPANSKTQEKKGPKTKSFIEQYMAGGFGDLTGDGSMPELIEQEKADDVEVEETRPSEPRQPRAKIDRQKLRENMDSFRTLSTQSVENALVNHALRQERSNINGRITFIVVLVGMSAFLAIANAKGIIQQPSLIWITLVATIGASAELARKYYSVRVRTKGILAPEESAAPVPVNSANHLSTNPLAAEDFEKMRSADGAMDPIAARQYQRDDVQFSETPSSEGPANRDAVKVEESDSRSKYFEL